MTYASEEIINALKGAREAKGLSQRELSARTGVPQSHISKIESSNADIRLSSLIELARALDLEVKLVPRKALAAVDSVVRSTAPATPPAGIHRNAAKELRRALSTIGDLRGAYPDLEALRTLQQNLQTISHFQALQRNIDAIQDITKPLRDLQKQTDQLKRLGEIAALPKIALRPIEDAARAAQHLRNQLVHNVPTDAVPRPAYRLDDDKHGETGDG